MCMVIENLNEVLAEKVCLVVRRVAVTSVHGALQE